MEKIRIENSVKKNMKSHEKKGLPVDTAMSSFSQKMSQLSFRVFSLIFFVTTAMLGDYWLSSEQMIFKIFRWVAE